MKKETYYCDECGAERKQANHWFLFIPHTEATKQVRGNAHIDIPSRGVDVIPWCEQMAATTFAEGIFHVCGQTCGHSALDRFMSTGKLEK